ncbi:MAG: asparagine synthase (glutamine-hydrolyzing) [Alphaproteobacteria bacterium]|nr:asparagine synthase (glutamine-hydrolyzing) [Alphaproteobacteria bacterium]
MCGIISYLSKNSTLSEEQFFEACNTLNHRGPDNTTTWVNENKTVYLGHNRLSIIDFETGIQPIFNEDKSLAIIVNGEFYNHDAIRENLLKEGFKFKTKSDSEILIPLYKKYGIDCLHHLNGEFAFILYDKNENLIFVGRDRFGIKPLHYAVYQGNIFFASEAKALFKMGVPGKLNFSNCFAAYSFLPLNNHSVFEHIQLVKPGHFLKISLETLDIKECEYWNLKFPQMNSLPTKIDEQAYVEEFARLFENSVKLRLRSDQPVGCYLSGGLDSSSVIGVMKKFSNTPVEAFTIAFEDPLYNEGGIALETSNFVGAKQHILHMNNQILADNFEDSIYHVEQPVINTHGVAKFLLSKTARDAGIRVILTGEGADELLAGYIAFKIDELNVGTDQNKNDILQDFLKRNPASAGLFFSNNQVESSSDLEYIKSKLGFVPQILKVSEGTQITYSGLIKKEYDARLKASNPIRTAFDHIYTPTLDGIELLNKSLYFLSKSMLPGYILTALGDRMEMAHSIEGRPPFFDQHLVEFILQLPVSLKIKNWREKYILREAMKDVITDTLYKREKHPFLAPPVSRSNKNAFYLYMKDMFHSDLLKHSTIFEAKLVLQKFNNFDKLSPEEQTNSNNLYLNILSTLILEKKFT